MSWFNLATWTGKALVAVLLALAVFGFFQLRSCQQSAQHEAESRLQSGQLGAAQNSAADAVNTVAADARRTADSEALTRANEREIRNAPGANVAVNPAAHDAGLHALCQRAAYRDTERCRVLNPHSP